LLHQPSELGNINIILTVVGAELSHDGIPIFELIGTVLAFFFFLGIVYWILRERDV